MADQLTNNDPARSRRALLTAAVGGAAAVAAQAALPLTAQAADPNDVVKNIINTTTDTTGIDSSATADVDAFAASAGGTGSAVVASSVDGPAVEAAKSVAATAAAAYVTSGDASGAVPTEDTTFTGVYGFTETEEGFAGTGVWGDSADAGVVGTGSFIGTLGFGVWGVYGESVVPGGTGVYAFAQDTDRRALYVDGKVGFRRSGKTTITAGHSTKVISLAGVGASSLVFAQLGSNRSGRWVRAVVPSSGKFTVYLNSAVTSTTFIIWWVIN